MTIPVGILGATGAVGQRLVTLLDDHPDFDVTVVTASSSSAGRPYRRAAKWRIDTPIPSSVADLEVKATEPASVDEDVQLLFSSLPSSIGAEVEPEFAANGYIVSSNSSNARLDDDVPLIIPEVNPDHLSLIDLQRDERGWSGALLKNPNCSTITMVPTLAALDRFGLERVHVSTMQAVSGAGYSGVTSMEIIDNVLPHIGGEEEKMETETRKLLGRVGSGGMQHHPAPVSASCNRVPTIDGHLENVWVETAEDVDPETAEAALRDAPTIDLPSAPAQLVHVFDDPMRPQPRLDRMVDRGMAVSVGPVQSTPFGLQYDCLAHNTLRGAAGASLLNGELLLDRGYL